MAKKNTKSNGMGKTKRSTDDMIDNAIAQQHSWLENRRTFTRSFLKKLNVFTHTADTTPANTPAPASHRRSGLAAYWFPILCAVAVIFIAVWVMFVRTNRPATVIAPAVPEPVVRNVVERAEMVAPSFDIVRIDRDGALVVAGRWMASKNI